MNTSKNIFALASLSLVRIRKLAAQTCAIGVLILLFAAIGCTRKESHQITADGRATVKAPVDYFEIRVSVRTEAQTFTQANNANKAFVRRVFEVFRKFQIPDSDFVTKTSETEGGSLPYRLPPHLDRWKQKPAVEYSGTLTLHNPDIYDVLFRELVKLEKVEIGVFGFGCYSVEGFGQEAYRQAVAKAKQQAELLLAGTSQKPGKIVKLFGDGRTRYIDSNGHEYVGSPASIHMATPTEPSTFRKKYFEVSASVTVTYEIL